MEFFLEKPDLTISLPQEGHENVTVPSIFTTAEPVDIHVFMISTIKYTL